MYAKHLSNYDYMHMHVIAWYTSLSPGTAAAVGVGAGAFGALGAVVMGFTGPVAVASLAAAAVGTAIAG